MDRSFIRITLLLLVVLAGCGMQKSGDKQVDPQAGRFMSAAENAFQARSYKEALMLADSAEKVQPDLPHIDQLRGQIFLAMNDFGRARQAYERSIEKDPTFRGNYFLLGNVAFNQGKYREALQHYSRERELVTKARGADRRVYKSIDVVALPRVLLQTGMAYERLGAVDTAKQMYEESLKLDAANPTTHEWLGNLAEKTGDTQAALQHAVAAQKLSPENPDFNWKLGTLYLKQNKAPEALPYLQKALSIRPWHAGTVLSYGRALNQVGRTKEAEEVLSRVDQVQALTQKTTEAESAAFSDGRSVRRWIELARLYLAAGRFEDAMKAFNVALYLEPNNLQIHNDVANLALAVGDRSGAIERYQLILAKDSTFSDAWFNLGVAYAQQGQMSAARHAWESALTYQPGHKEARAYLAKAKGMQ